MISHSPVSSVLVRVNIVAARLTNICNKTMCALLSSARLGDALPRLQLWPGCWVVTWPGLGLLQHSGDRVTLCLERRERDAAGRGGRHGGEQESRVDTTHIAAVPPARLPSLKQVINLESGKMFMMFVLCKNFSMMNWRLINQQRWSTTYLMMANGAASEL